MIPWLRERINEVRPGAFDRLEEIASFEKDEAVRILSVILRFSCDAQNIGTITAGRSAFKRLPAEWLRTNLRANVDQAINLEDSWAFRRLLEILEETNSSLLDAYINRGLESKDPEVKEAAKDFADKR
jgi:hypothetical protein